MTKQYIIAVDIQTTAPLHISAIEKGRYDPARQNILRYDNAQVGIGCALTRTLPMLDAATVAENQSVVVPLVPVIPASTVAGKLRRAAAELIFNSFIGRDLNLSADAYNTMTSGSASTGISAKDAKPETLRTARLDPFFGLFGGTSLMLKAHSVIGEGWPIVAQAKDKLMTEPLVSVSAVSRFQDMTDAVAVIKKNDVLDLRGKYIEGVIGIETIAKYALAQNNSIASSKAQKTADEEARKAAAKDGKKAVIEEGTKTDLRTFNATEVVKPGMSFGLRVKLDARTPAHLGLMMLAMQGLLREGQIGGKGARGMGQFMAQASRLYEVDPSSRKMTVVASLFGDKNNGYELAENAVVQEAVIAAQDYIDAVSPLMFEAYAAADIDALQKLAS